MNIGYAIEHFPQAKFAVVTPAHQSPMGVSLSLSRRMALLDWAASREAWIIEDDYDSEFRYQGQPLPSLKSLDTRGRVIYAGTFSKVMFPALRLGYVVVPENLVDSISDYCHLRACASPRLMQTSVAEFIAQGHFYRHLKRMRQLYVERRAFLTRALAARFPSDLLWVNPQAGGIQLCANLASQYDDAAIARHARSQGLAIQALSEWQVESREKGNPLRPNGLLMGFPNISTQKQADTLCEKLEAVMRESAQRTEN
jgi:GntR family transcriptional regulator/MocR family aminotransferase